MPKKKKRLKKPKHSVLEYFMRKAAKAYNTQLDYAVTGHEAFGVVSSCKKKV